MKKVTPDIYLNHYVKLRRIGYTALGVVNSLDSNMYKVEVVRILSGETLVTPGDVITLSTGGMSKSATVVTGSVNLENN